MIKTGIVTEVNKKYACILTPSGEFLRIKYKGSAPSIGHILSGDLYKITKIKLPLLAASLAFTIFTGGLCSYYVPAYAVTVDINPSVKLHVNMWDKVVSAEAINDDGQQLLSHINVKNMSVDDGLHTIVEEAKKDNFINEDYTSTGEKAVKVTVEGKTPKTSALKNFENELKKENINLQIVEDKDKSTSKTKDVKKTEEKVKPKDVKPNTNLNNKNDLQQSENLNDKAKKDNEKNKEKNTAKDKNNEVHDAKPFNEGNEKSNGKNKDKKSVSSKEYKGSSMESVSTDTNNFFSHGHKK